MKKHLQSFKTDKAVVDNIVESWLCIDCGVNTAPGLLSGPELRIALALYGEAPQTIDNRAEVYHEASARVRAAANAVTAAAEVASS